jgi:predicted Zn-dependent protease
MRHFSQRFRLFSLIIIPFLIAVIIGITPQQDSISNKWNRIRHSQKEENIQNTISDYKDILLQQPWKMQQWRELANLQSEAQDYIGVIDSYHQIQDKVDLTIDENLALAEAYFQTNQDDPGLQLLSKISDQNPTAEIYQEIVFLQQEYYDWYSAYQTLQKWFQNDPQNANLLYQLGLSQLIFDPAYASDTLLSAVANDTKYSSRVHAILEGLENITNQENTTYRLVLTGRLLSQQSEWKYASAAFDYSTQLDPEYAEGWALLGNSLKYLNKDGLYALENAQKLDPNSKISNEMLAIYWREHDDIPKSLMILNHLADDEPAEAFWRFEIGNTLVYQGDLYGALEAYVKATELSPDDSFYWLSLAQFTIDYKISMETVGLTAARQAIVLEPNNSQAKDVIGVIFMNLENYASAERFLNEAFAEQPSSSLINLHLGQLYLKIGDNKNAVKHFQECIKLAQNEDIRLAAQNYLAILR